MSRSFAKRTERGPSPNFVFSIPKLPENLIAGQFGMIGGARKFAKKSSAKIFAISNFLLLSGLKC